MSRSKLLNIWGEFSPETLVVRASEAITVSSSVYYPGHYLFVFRQSNGHIPSALKVYEAKILQLLYGSTVWLNPSYSPFEQPQAKFFRKQLADPDAPPMQLFVLKWVNCCWRLGNSSSPFNIGCMLSFVLAKEVYFT